jgi:hypothetical protein
VRPRRAAALAALAWACSRAAPPEPAPEPAPAPRSEAPAEAAPAEEGPGPVAPAPPPAPAPAPQPRAPAPSPEAGPAPAPPALDLDALEVQLRETSALGFMTKLTLKNDIDDLVADAKAYHERGQGRLEDLRQRFELLLMKVLALLQEREPALAAEIARSREALWQLLADPAKLAAVSPP